MWKRRGSLAFYVFVLFCFATGMGDLIIGKERCLHLYLVSLYPPFCQSSQNHIVKHSILFPNSLEKASLTRWVVAFAFLLNCFAISPLNPTSLMFPLESKSHYGSGPTAGHKISDVGWIWGLHLLIIRVQVLGIQYGMRASQWPSLVCRTVTWIPLVATWQP